MYDSIFGVLKKYVKPATLFRVMFNVSPMYRRSCGKLYFVSEDLHLVKIRIPLTYRNKNYVGSMFGGSLFSATDPIYMIQLMQILGKDYVVWDKATQIRFRKPAYSNAFVDFEFSIDEINEIKRQVQENKEIDFVKKLNITDGKETVFTELEKTLYISSKEHYRQKRAKVSSK
ncbi:DUF4442 domain-containing protein [Flavobacterium sp. NRK F10]|nr:DUF4442 domain-containing protein [Flavobacterium sp. NRK F10]MCO6173532.1 DUF4442 domain-containing protein [Flavobacterium sp. NRK F10]